MGAKIIRKFPLVIFFSQQLWEIPLIEFNFFHQNQEEKKSLKK